jgi:hypothetical protein
MMMTGRHAQQQYCQRSTSIKLTPAIMQFQLSMHATSNLATTSSIWSPIVVQNKACMLAAAYILYMQVEYSIHAGRIFHKNLPQVGKQHAPINVTSMPAAMLPLNNN